jgi:outer membrane protein TolC
MGVSEKSIESASEALRITAELYKEGVADITVLLTAQVGLTTQKTRSVAAYYDYLTALSNYDRARGVAMGHYLK